MSEKVIICCDRCNEDQNSHSYQGRGIVETASEQDAIDYFEWSRLPNGEIICIDCQDEDETCLD